MSLLQRRDDLLRTRATVAVHGRARRRAIEAGRRAMRTLLSHVRRDVGGASLAEATGLLARLGSVLGVLEGQVVHVELVGHDCDVVD